VIMSVFEALTLMITFAILVVKIFAETHRKK